MRRVCPLKLKMTLSLSEHRRPLWRASLDRRQLQVETSITIRSSHRANGVDAALAAEKAKPEARTKAAASAAAAKATSIAAATAGEEA